MNNIEAHISELSGFLTLIENGQFKGKDAQHVLRLKDYLNEILVQLVDFQTKMSVDNAQ